MAEGIMRCTFSWKHALKGFKKCALVPPPESTSLSTMLAIGLLAVVLSTMLALMIFEAHHQLTKVSRAPPGYVCCRTGGYVKASAEMSLLQSLLSTLSSFRSSAAASVTAAAGSVICLPSKVAKKLRATSSRALARMMGFLASIRQFLDENLSLIQPTPSAKSMPSK
mmetsp:Transcript_2768/g.5740  ORF Transcript_2768/g.5740 Transcript_2768/m.5740 type:complete len:167 (+) Transcript_2768:19-519(+)